MSRLQQCIDALEASRDNICCCGGKEGRCVVYEHYNDAIAIVSRILSAEPSEEEIEKIGNSIGFAIEGVLSMWTKATKKRVVKAALLTAFPQQEKI